MLTVLYTVTITVKTALCTVLKYIKCDTRHHWMNISMTIHSPSLHQRVLCMTEELGSCYEFMSSQCRGCMEAVEQYDWPIRLATTGHSLHVSRSTCVEVQIKKKIMRTSPEVKKNFYLRQWCRRGRGAGGERMIL